MAVGGVMLKAGMWTSSAAFDTVHRINEGSSSENPATR